MRTKYIGMLLWIFLLFTGCSGQGHESEGTQSNPSTGFVVAGPNSYDSADTAVLADKNSEKGTLSFLNIKLGKTYTLSFDGTTTLYDKYGEALSIDQFEKGDIVSLTFLKNKKHLNSMQKSNESWINQEISRYNIDTTKNEITIGTSIYKFTKDTLFFSDGNLVEAMDINAMDILTFQGIENTILSVTVEQGHGYLKLKNDENFIGGYIEVGLSVIRPIEEGMLLVVSEGEYEVNISHNGGGGKKNVIIRRNEETVLDIGDLEIATTQEGTVIFSLNPSNASLYIDGTLTDTTTPITLDYGLHQIIARADNYQTVTKYIKVGQASAGIDITLEAIESKEEDKEQSLEVDTSEDTGGNTNTTTSYYQVHIDAPENAEVYLNGNYVGIAPTSFKKESGAHTITLRRTNYETRSYTILIDNEDKDISYSFAELVAN